MDGWMERYVYYLTFFGEEEKVNRHLELQFSHIRSISCMLRAEGEIRAISSASVGHAMCTSGIEDLFHPS